MTSIRFLMKFIPASTRNWLNLRPLSISVAQNCKEVFDFPDEKVKIPEYEDRTGEALEVQRARVIYQARKRGTLENGLLLSTFAAKYVRSMNEKQLMDFDRLLNKPGNEWDIYYWATGTKPTPPEYDHKVMQMLKEHCQNDDRELRIRQPDLC